MLTGVVLGIGVLAIIAYRLWLVYTAIKQLIGGSNGFTSKCGINDNPENKHHSSTKVNATNSANQKDD
jgi:hypothetical protein